MVIVGEKGWISVQSDLPLHVDLLTRKVDKQTRWRFFDQFVLIVVCTQTWFCVSDWENHPRLLIPVPTREKIKWPFRTYTNNGGKYNWINLTKYFDVYSITQSKFHIFSVTGQTCMVGYRVCGKYRSKVTCSHVPIRKTWNSSLYLLPIRFDTVKSYPL